MVREKEVTLIQFDDDPEENKNDKECKYIIKMKKNNKVSNILNL